MLNATVRATNNILNENTDSLKENKKATDDESKSKNGRLFQLNEELSLLKKQQAEYSNTSSDFSDYADKIISKQKEIDAIMGIGSKREKVTPIQLNSTENEVFIKQLTEQRDKVIKLRDANQENSEEFKRYNQILSSINNAFELITDNRALLKAGDDWIENLNEQADSLNKVSEKAKESEEAIKSFLGVFLDDFISQTGFETLFDVLNGQVEDFGKNWKTTFVAIAEISQEAFAFVNKESKQRFDTERERLKQQKEISLVFAGQTTEARQEIDRQYDEKLRMLQNRQAKREKELALFNIAIDTAQAVISALAEVPYPANIAAAIAVGVIGAAQGVLVASRDIPQFKDGVRDFSGGLAIVGDGGKHEYIKTPDGQVAKTPNKDTLVNLPKGTDVFKDKADLMKSETQYRGVPVNNFNGITKEDLDNVIGSHFANITTNQTTIDKKGFSTFIVKNNTRINKLNNRATGKGFQV